MKVCEIFVSIQGESTYAGLPCTFVRLTGCNLRCAYCDTVYAYTEGSDMSEDDVVDKVRRAGVGLVEITGGEPLLQRGSLHLAECLLDNEYTVLIETNGSMNIGEVDRRAVVILDVKTPGSGMNDRMDLQNLYRVKQSDEVKFVLTGREDYEWAKEIVRRYDLSGRCSVLLSPAYGILSAEILAGWMTEDRIQARLNLQLHKYIFSPERRGV